MRCDVAVVGSGVAGMTAAAILARKGRKVVVLERKPRPGGALKRFTRNRITFDVGFHATAGLGRGDVLHSLWTYCGVMPDLEVIPFPEHSCDQYEFDDYPDPIRCYFSYERIQEELRRHFPGESGAIAAYFGAVREICAASPFYHPELPLTPFLRTPPPPFRRLADFLGGITANPFLQAVLAAPIYLYGVPSRAASLEIHAQVVHGYYTRTYIVDGGGQAVVDAFLGSLARLGVEVVTGETVAAIRVEGGRACGVSTASGRVVESRDVVHAGHPAEMIPMLPETVFRASYRSRFTNLRNSTSFFMLFGALDAPPRPDVLDWTNLYRFRPGLDILPAGPDLAPAARGMMLNCPGRRDVRDREANKDGVILFQPAYWQDVEQFEGSAPRRRPEAYRDYKERLTAQMLDTARRNWGDVAGAITPLAVGTPLSFRDELSSPEGSAYGALHGIDQATPYVRTRLPGLWLCGQSTLMTGVMSASLSGMVAAGEMTGLEQLWEEVRAC